MQKITVQNKGQLLAAIECAKDCPVSTEIRFTGVSTVYIIEGSMGRVFEEQPKSVSRLKSRAKKLAASLFK